MIDIYDVNWRISPYSICILFAFILGVSYICCGLFSKKVRKDYIGYSLLLTFPSALYGAFLMTFISHLSLNRKTIVVGFSSLGGAIGMLIGLIIILAIIRYHTLDFLRTYTISLGLLYGVSKLGCLFGACCHGIPYSGPCSVVYHNFDRVSSVARFPVQPLESILFLIAFLLINIVNKKHEDKTILLCSIFYPLIKFSMDFLREKNRYILSSNQVICLILCGLGISLHFLLRKIPDTKLGKIFNITSN